MIPHIKTIQEEIKQMAKANNGPVKHEKEQAPKPPQAPAGYRRQTQDPVGFWNWEKSPIHWIPRSVKLFDGNIEKSKPSILVIGELLDPCLVTTKDEDEKTAKPGDIVGVFYKPGMKALANLCDAKVWMNQNGELATGKPNPMKLFEVNSPGPNKKFVLVFDERKVSAGVDTAFARARKVVTQQEADVADDDNLPF